MTTQILSRQTEAPFARAPRGSKAEIYNVHGSGPSMGLVCLGWVR